MIKILITEIGSISGLFLLVVAMRDFVDSILSYRDKHCITIGIVKSIIGIVIIITPHIIFRIFEQLSNLNMPNRRSVLMLVLLGSCALFLLFIVVKLIISYFDDYHKEQRAVKKKQKQQLIKQMWFDTLPQSAKILKE